MKINCIAFAFLLCVNSMKVVCGYYGGYTRSDPNCCECCECPEFQTKASPYPSSARTSGPPISRSSSMSSKSAPSTVSEGSIHRSVPTSSSSPYAPYMTYRSFRGPPSSPSSPSMSSTEFKSKLMALLNNLNENKDSDGKGGSNNNNGPQPSTANANNQPLTQNNGFGNTHDNAAKYPNGEYLPSYNINGAQPTNYNPANQHVNYNSGPHFANNGNGYNNQGMGSSGYMYENQLQPQIYEGSGLPTANKNNGYNDAGLINTIKSVNDIGSPRSLISDSNSPLTNIYNNL